MAGYMKKLNGYVYDGEHKAYAALANGTFVEIGANGVVAVTAAGDAEFRVDEKTTLWGLPAVVLNCVIEGTKEQYFLENDHDIYNKDTYDLATATCAVGEYCRMHRPVVNDQLIMTVSDETYAALAVGDTVKAAVGGSIAKKA